MVDIMSQNESKLPKSEDYEDGELPEDGEICDDEEDVPKPASVRPALFVPEFSAPHTSSSSTGHRDSINRDREHGRDRGGERDRDRERERDRGGERNGGIERGGNDRERNERCNRRFDDQPPVRDNDPFGSHNDELPTTDYFGASSGNGDKDYRSVEEEVSSDIDYRVNNRRRRLTPPAEEDYDHRSKRPFYGGRGGFRGGAGGGGYRGGPKPRFQTEHQICKFFREGYCRDGDGCSYSHQAEDSLRRPLLCNFYANSFCKKGLQCLMLHGEYPCKEFHRGNCNNDQCRYSHVPLTEYTTKIMADEEARAPAPHPAREVYRPNPVANAAAAAAAAALPTRRRVLLPGGPAPTAPSPPPHATPVIHVPVPQQPVNGQLAPPSVVVPTIQRPIGSYPQNNGYFNPTQQVQNLPPPRTIEPPRPVSHIPSGSSTDKPNQPVFNLEAMLNKLAKGGVSDTENDDSPASPPPVSAFDASLAFLNSTATRTIPQIVTTTWKLVGIRQKAPYSNVENVERIATSDPRKTKALLNQFSFSTLGNEEEDTTMAFEDPRLRNNVQEVKKTSVISSWMPQVS